MGYLFCTCHLSYRLRPITDKVAPIRNGKYQVSNLLSQTSIPVAKNNRFLEEV